MAFQEALAALQRKPGNERAMTGTQNTAIAFRTPQPGLAQPLRHRESPFTPYNFFANINCLQYTSARAGNSRAQRVTTPPTPPTPPRFARQNINCSSDLDFNNNLATHCVQGLRNMPPSDQVHDHLNRGMTSQPSSHSTAYIPTNSYKMIPDSSNSLGSKNNRLDAALAQTYTGPSNMAPGNMKPLDRANLTSTQQFYNFSSMKPTKSGASDLNMSAAVSMPSNTFSQMTPDSMSSRPTSYLEGRNLIDTFDQMTPGGTRPPHNHVPGGYGSWSASSSTPFDSTPVSNDTGYNTIYTGGNWVFQATSPPSPTPAGNLQQNHPSQSCLANAGIPSVVESGQESFTEWNDIANSVEHNIALQQAQMADRLGDEHFQKFRPADILNAGQQPPRGNWPLMRRLNENVSANYQGDLNLRSNHSAAISNDRNCALWITGLPSDVNHTQLLASIRGVGKIFATVINPPNGFFNTAAAKIVFFTHESALMLQTIIQNGQFSVAGTQLRPNNVRWNKIRSAPFQHIEQSRSIRISGRRKDMRFEFFDKFFRQRFAFQVDFVAEVPNPTIGCVSHDWHFGSLRCQAASAKIAIEKELSGIILVEWIRDPCE